MKRVSSVFIFTMVGLATADIALASYCFILKNKLQEDLLNVSVPAISGYDLSDAKWTPLSARCHVIRITADDCEFCRTDQRSYDMLLSVARESKCQIIEMAPRAGDMASNPRPGIVQLKYLDVDLGRLLSPVVTPQTVVLDHTWTVKWSRRGAFLEQSLADAVTAIRNLDKPPPSMQNADSKYK